MSQDCSFEKLGYTVLTCWDPVGNQNDKPRTGSICEMPQRANNITDMVICTSRGWSKVKEKQYRMHILKSILMSLYNPLFAFTYFALITSLQKGAIDLALYQIKISVRSNWDFA